MTRTRKLFSLVILTLGFASSAPNIVAQQGPATATSDAGRASTPAEQSPEKKKEVADENDVYLHSPAVQSFGRALGMNPEQAATTFTFINFAVLAILVGWFLVRTLPKTFRNRNAAIQKHLVEARAATEESGARLSSVEERLGKLDAQIAQMRDQSEKDSALDEQRIKASVDEERTRILAAAEQEIAAATHQAQRQIQKYAAELAIEQAARKLSISAETDRLLIQNFAHRLGADESKEGQN